MPITHDIAIPAATVDKMRERPCVREISVLNHALRNLEYVPMYKVRDIEDGMFVPGGPIGDRMIQTMTGREPEVRTYHPGKAQSATWFEAYPVGVVAHALLSFHRLGCFMYDCSWLQPLWKRLCSKRDYPILSWSELDILWTRREVGLRSVYVFRYTIEDPSQHEPITVTRLNTTGFVCVRFVNRNSTVVEAIAPKAGKRLEGAMLDAGGLFTLRTVKQQLEAS